MKNYLIILLALAWQFGQAQTPETTPNDPLFNLQWGAKNTGQVPVYPTPSLTVGTPGFDSQLKKAWTETTGSPNVVIAILDGGMNPIHEDFDQNRLWTNQAELNGTIGVDDDGNGYIDDIHGINAINNGSPLTSFDRHGPAVTNIITATPNNGKGITGVDWNAKVMPIRIVDGGGQVFSSIMVEGINYAIDNGADIISMSWGLRLGQQPACNGGSACNFTPEELEEMRVAMNAAYDAGIVLVASTGNDDEQVLEYPAALDNVLAVGAAGPCGTRKTGSRTGPLTCVLDSREENGTPSWGSNYGPHVDLLAAGTQIPIVDIAGTTNGFSDQSEFFNGVNNGQYVTNVYGTSFATPFVAGVAALMLAENPNLEPCDVYTILRATATDMGAFGRDDETGYGLVNAHAAVQLAKNWSGFPINVNLANQTIADDAAYVASFSITAGPNLTVAPATHLTLKSGNRIEFKEGFSMGSGATMSATIEDPFSLDECTSSSKTSTWEPEAPVEVAADLAGLESYPNPFQGQTTLRFRLAAGSQARLQVFDAKGQLVATPFVGEVQDANWIEAIWEAQSMPAGIYLARLTTEQGLAMTHRMVLQD